MIGKRIVDRRGKPPIEPSNYSVRTCLCENGERLPLVVDRSGLPVPMPNHYGLLVRRQRLQPSSLAEELATIASLHDWADRRRIDIDERINDGNGLTPREMEALLDFLRYARPFGRFVADSRLHDADTEKVVSHGVHGNRILIVRDYLVWGMNETLSALDVGDLRYRHIVERRDRMQRIADDYELPEDRTGREGLTPPQRSRLLQVIVPTFVANPFNKPVRFRNYVLLMLLLMFGLRRGESLKLYVSDLVLRGAKKPVMRVVRRPDDPNDPRRNEPRVKTLGREIPLDHRTASMLSEFVLYHRSEFPGADRSPFLFISAHGEPISLRQVNTIFSQIRSRFSEFSGVLTPHVLRHTYNDMLSEVARENNVPQEDEIQLRNYLNGWSPRSLQGNHYRRRFIIERANRISLEHQRRLFEVEG